MFHGPWAGLGMRGYLTAKARSSYYGTESPFAACHTKHIYGSGQFLSRVTGVTPLCLTRLAEKAMTWGCEVHGGSVWEVAPAAIREKASCQSSMCGQRHEPGCQSSLLCWF